jgi:TctA family transporter
MSDGSMGIFFERSLATPIMIVAIILFLVPVFQMIWRRARGGQQSA